MGPQIFAFSGRGRKTKRLSGIGSTANGTSATWKPPPLLPVIGVEEAHSSLVSEVDLVAKLWTPFTLQIPTTLCAEQ